MLGIFKENKKGDQKTIQKMPEWPRCVIQEGEQSRINLFCPSPSPLSPLCHCDAPVLHHRPSTSSRVSSHTTTPREHSLSRLLCTLNTCLLLPLSLSSPVSAACPVPLYAQTVLFPCVPNRCSFGVAKKQLCTNL